MDVCMIDNRSSATTCTIIELNSIRKRFIIIRPAYFSNALYCLSSTTGLASYFGYHLFSKLIPAYRRYPQMGHYIYIGNFLHRTNKIPHNIPLIRYSICVQKGHSLRPLAHINRINFFLNADYNGTHLWNYFFLILFIIQRRYFSGGAVGCSPGSGSFISTHPLAMNPFVYRLLPPFSAKGDCVVHSLIIIRADEQGPFMSRSQCTGYTNHQAPQEPFYSCHFFLLLQHPRRSSAGSSLFCTHSA